MTDGPTVSRGPWRLRFTGRAEGDLGSVSERGPDGVNAQLVFPEGDDPGALVNATAARTAAAIFTASPCALINSATI